MKQRASLFLSPNRSHHLPTKWLLFQEQISQFLSSFVLSLTKLTSINSSRNLLSLSIRYGASSCLAFSHASPLSCLQPKEQVQWCRAATRKATHTHTHTRHKNAIEQSEEVTRNLCFPSLPALTLSPFLCSKRMYEQTFKFSSEKLLKKAVNKYGS